MNFMPLTYAGIILFTIVGSALAQDLTIPPVGYSGTVSSQDLIKRTNNDYPLSDQANKGGWKINPTFTDEFDGASLNTERWHPTNPQWRGRRPTQFHPANTSLEDGELVMRINQHGDEKLRRGYTHSSGYIKSKQTILYGYFEMEAKLMDAPWVSGFWLYNHERDWWTEIDICENCPGVEKNRQDLNSNVHVFYSPPEHGDVKKHFSITKKYYFPLELQNDYHVWGLEWNKEVIRFFIDGVLFREVENTHWHQPLTINVNNESNKWFGALPEEDREDRDYRVNYVRVWDRGGPE